MVDGTKLRGDEIDEDIGGDEPNGGDEIGGDEIRGDEIGGDEMVSLRYLCLYLSGISRF